MKRSRELDQSHEEVQLREIVEVTGIQGNNTRRRIIFGEIDESDEEVTFDSQAHKRRKMSKEVEELKMWITVQIAELSTKKQSQDIQNSISNHTSMIAENRAAGKANADKIEKMGDSISNIERSLGIARSSGLLGTDVDRGQQNTNGLQQPSFSEVAASSTTSTRPLVRPIITDEEYEICRRSVLLWPIAGDSPAEMLANYEKFWEQALRTPAGNFGKIKISRERSAPNARAYLVTCITFGDVYQRDEFFALGPHLADYRDGENKPTCGIRLHIPKKLMPSFKILESFGFEMRRKHERDEVKRHIKFDDSPNLCISR